MHALTYLAIPINHLPHESQHCLWTLKEMGPLLPETLKL